MQRKVIADASKGWIEQNLENKKVLGKTEEVEWHKMVIQATEECCCMQLKVAWFCIMRHQRVNLLIVFQMDLIIYK